MPKDPKRVKAGKRSKRKGRSGEQQVVNLAKSLGLEAKRTWETAANQDPRLRKTDVVIEDIRVQVKFKKGGFGALYRALEGVDVAMVRQNGKGWLVVMPVEDYLKEKLMAKEFMCWLCRKPVDEEYLCSGCGKYICEACDETQVMGHGHDPMAHKVAF